MTNGFYKKKAMARDRFATFEDPMYDEDGVLVDEDYEMDDPTNFIAEIESYDPRDTINS